MAVKLNIVCLCTKHKYIVIFKIKTSTEKEKWVIQGLMNKQVRRNSCENSDEHN